jgi:uncharacterized protein with HEPN domain
MLDHALSVQRMLAGRNRSDLDQNEMFRLALVRAIEVIGEAAGKVSADGRQAHPDIPWSQMAAARNRLIHGYDIINLDILWRIAAEDVPPLIVELRKMLGEE